MTGAFPETAELRPEKGVLRTVLDGNRGFALHGVSATWLQRRGRNGLHEPKLAAILAELALGRRDGAFFDIGALHGYFSFLVSAWSEGRRPVHTFEMNPQSFRQIQVNLRRNRAEDPRFGSIRLHHAAIGATEGVRETRIKGFRLDLPEDVADASTEQIPFHSIDRHTHKTGVMPAFVKIDVEGWEGAVVNGMARTLRLHAPVIAMELHQTAMIAPTGHSRVSVLQTLLGIGYRCYAIPDHRRGFAPGDIPVELVDPGHVPGERNFERQGEALVLCCKDPLSDVIPRILHRVRMA